MKSSGFLFWVKLFYAFAILKAQGGFAVASGHKQVMVGDFFERVGHQLFGGDLSRDENGDLCLWRQERTIEIKSSGTQSSYGFRLSIEQIENYERLVEFPFSSALYVFFAYQNNQRKTRTGKRSTELTRFKTPPAINNYLASSVIWCLAVDLSIVSRWKAKLPRSTKSILGHLGTETIDMKWRELYEYTNGGLHDRLKALEINPEHLSVLEGQARVQVKADLLEAHSMKFPLTVILPQEEGESFRRRFYRRGLRLKFKKTA